MASLILVLGLGSALTQLALNAMRDSLIDADVAQLRAIGDIQANVTDSHLWMEEFVTGDTVSHGEIWVGIERSRELVRAMLEGSALDVGRYAVRAVSDARLRAGIVALDAEVEHFAAVAAQREAAYRGGARVGVGTAADAEYDRMFHALIAHAQTLRAEIEQRMAASLGRTRLLSRSILAAWVLMVALAFVGLARLERHRVAAEQALRESELQLAQAQKLEAVGRLASGLAHDINNYLAAITAQSELVKRKPPTASDPAAIQRLRGRMDDVIATANRAAALIQRLLTFSSQQAVHPAVHSLNRIVENMHTLMQQVLGDDVALTLRLEAQPWNVKVDLAQVEQIMLNLLVNAREAMSDGGKVLVETRNVRLEPRDLVQQRIAIAPGEYVMLAVSDTGMGIPAADQGQIFEPFFSTKQRAQNSGLGLATVYGIVKQGLGGIALESVSGQGTTFRVYLPRSLETPMVSSTPPATQPTAGGSERLLLIEDNAELREPTRALLVSLGYTVLVAQHGADALALLERGDLRVDVIVTDVVMPGLSGPMVVERIIARQGPVPVLFLSGHGETVLAQYGAVAVPHRFLQKPFAAETLARELRVLLDQGKDTPDTITVA